MLFGGITCLALFLPAAPAKADCTDGVGSSISADKTDVPTRDTAVTITTVVTYSTACQQQENVTAVQLSLKAYDPAADPNGGNPININTSTQQFNGKSGFSTQGSIAVFNIPQFSALSKVALRAIVCPNGSLTLCTQSGNVITLTTSAAPGTPPDKITPNTGEPVPVDLHKPLLAGPGGTGEGGGTGIKQTVPGDFSTLLNRAVAFMVSFIAIIAIIFIIIGGFRLAFSAGNTEAITSGRKTITWAIIGLVIALMSFAIIRILDSLIF